MGLIARLAQSGAHRGLLTPMAQSLGRSRPHLLTPIGQQIRPFSTQLQGPHVPQWVQSLNLDSRSVKSAVVYELAAKDEQRDLMVKTTQLSPEMNMMPGVSIGDAMKGKVKMIPMVDGDTSDLHQFTMYDFTDLAKAVRRTLESIWDSGVVVANVNYDHMFVSRQKRPDGTGWDFHVKLIDFGSSITSSGPEGTNLIQNLKESYTAEEIEDDFVVEWVNNHWR